MPDVTGAADVIEVEDLRVELTTGQEILHGVSFTVAAGEIVALVGESGSGKTTIGTCVLAYLRRGAEVTGGRVRVLGEDVFAVPPRRLRQIRGGSVAFVSQDPASALSPARRIGAHFTEVLAQHLPQLSAAGARERIGGVLADVNLPVTRDFLRRYPHQLSGGQLQRVVLALAFILKPSAIVLDEPTTGLDVTTQAKVLDTIRELCRAHRVAAVYVSHDLSVVRELAARVIVLESGVIVEDRPTAEVFADPRHEYTIKLLAAIPDIARRRLLAPAPLAPDPLNPPPLAPAVATTGPVQTPVPIPAQPPCVLEVGGVNAWYGARQALADVSLSVRTGRCVALVGESGSGKSTLSRSIVGLNTGWEGEIAYAGSALARRVRDRSAVEQREVQYIFQSADRALNPRKSVLENVLVPVHHFFGLRGAEARRAALDAFEKVALPARLAQRRPRELSGGERQRAAIARAIACDPRVLICDEVTSALDVSVQAVILKLLDRLRREQDLSLLFVTHNLAVVREIADDVVVLRAGRVVESGSVDAVLSSPQADYTRRLLDDTPSLFRELA
jgi:peptide/nickel transport system ATP-binding protein